MNILIGMLAGAIFVVVGKFIEHHLKLRKEVELAKQTQTIDERTGHFVQVDCRQCGKLNRIPAEKVRHRPICGGCKHRLMPKRKITLYTVRNLEFDKSLSLELDTVMHDYRRFWETLDEHFSRRGVKSTVVVDPKDLPN